jgi:hypothetical protein
LYLITIDTHKDKLNGKQSYCVAVKGERDING